MSEYIITDKELMHLLLKSLERTNIMIENRSKETFQIEFNLLSSTKSHISECIEICNNYLNSNQEIPNDCKETILIAIGITENTYFKFFAN